MLAMLGQSLFQTMSTQRFGQQFVGKVANPSDLLLLSKAKPEPKRRSAAAAGDDGTSCHVFPTVWTPVPAVSWP